MNHSIQPKLFENSVTCSCGYSFQTRSTKQFSRTDKCSQCHPAYVGGGKTQVVSDKLSQFKDRFGSRTFIKK
jgi:large subunit ribosomal protein L31